MFSIIIPTYNRNDSLNKCIKSIKNNFNSSIAKIIIVDDGSKVPVSKTIDYSGIDKNKFVMIRTKNKGPAAARNLGIKNSNTRYLIFLDDDCTLEKNFIKKLKDVIKKYPNLYVLESDFVDPYKNNYYNKTWYLNYRYLLNNYKNYGGVGKYVKFLGNCYIIKKDLFKKIGLFDERFRTREDADFIIRLYNKRVPIILFYKIKIKHYSRNSFFSVIKQFYNYAKYQELLEKKWKNRIRIFNRHSNMEFLNYIKNLKVNLSKVKYVLILRYLGQQSAILLKYLKTFKIKKFFKESMHALFHIKNILIWR